MDEKISRREFLKWISKAMAGAALASPALEAILTENVSASEEKPPVEIGHEANGYKLTIRGHYNSDDVLEIDKTYTLLEKIIKKPTVVNNNVVFHKPSIRGDYNGGATPGILCSNTPYGKLIQFMPKIGIKPLKRRALIATFLHEYGHCWFAYMKYFVRGGDGWTEKFSRKNPVGKLKKLNYKKEERQEEYNADVFRNHILGKKCNKMFEEGFKLYNDYISKTRTKRENEVDFYLFDGDKEENNLRFRFLRPGEAVP